MDPWWDSANSSNKPTYFIDKWLIYLLKRLLACFARDVVPSITVRANWQSAELLFSVDEFNKNY